MRFTCSQRDFSTNLNLANRAVPSRLLNPRLGNILLFAAVQHQKITLTAYNDLNLGIRTSFVASVETGGEITLPAKLLNDIISRLPEGDVTLECNEELATTIFSGKGRYQIQGVGTEEFPRLPQVRDGNAIYLLSRALVEGLRGSLFAASNDETKQVLTGIHFKIQQDSLELAATNGHRLVVVETSPDTIDSADSAKKEPILDITVPAISLRELERMLNKSDETVGLHWNSSEVIFKWPNQLLVSRLLASDYPNYRQLIPTSFERQITVERRSLLSALGRIEVLAEKTGTVRLNIDSDHQELILSSEVADLGSGMETISAQIAGDSLETAFNIKYLMEGIKALSSEEIQMQLNTALSPVILTALGSLKMTYLIMPMQIRA